MIFVYFSHCKSMGANDPQGGAIFDPMLVDFIKRTTIHCYIQNMKALGLVVSEKKNFLCFSHDTPGAGPVWTPGARMSMQRILTFFSAKNNSVFAFEVDI